VRSATYVRPATDAEHRAQQREFARRAHAVNLDVGAALLGGLSTIEPASMDVARFFVLCGRPHRTNYADGGTMPTPSRGGRVGAGDDGLLGLVGGCRVGIVLRPTCHSEGHRAPAS
jgi:hypothetical protein